MLIYSVELDATSGKVVLGEKPLEFVLPPVADLKYNDNAVMKNSRKELSPSEATEKRKNKKQKRKENT